MAVAQLARRSWDTVARVDGRAIELALGDRGEVLADLRWIGVDEVLRTGGRVYFTIVTNLKTGRVVWIGDGKGRRGFLPFLRALGPQRRRRIQGAVSDRGLPNDPRHPVAEGRPRSRPLPHRAVAQRGAEPVAPAVVLGSAARRTGP